MLSKSYQVSDKSTLSTPFNTQSFLVSFILPPVIATDFVDRPIEITKLEHTLIPGEPSRSRKIMVIQGLGGAGKTQLTIRYARLYKDKYTGILWLEGSSRESLMNSILKYARIIPDTSLQQQATKFTEYLSSQKTNIELHASQLPNEPLPTFDNILQSFKHWLCMNGNSKWLIIFDNVDREYTAKDSQSYDLKSYLPDSDHGSILITTRQLRMCQLGKSLSLVRMSKEQSLQLLSERSGIHKSRKCRFLLVCGTLLKVQLSKKKHKSSLQG